MPKYGFTAVGPKELSFGSDGNWYADDEVIGNERIALLFSSHVRADDEHGWVIDLGVDCQPFRVVDTPLVVRRVDGDPDTGLAVRTNDGVSSPLELDSLVVGAGEVLYCTVDRGDRGRIPARFLRPAYYQLAAHMEPSADGFVLRSRDRSVTVTRAGGSS